MAEESSWVCESTDSLAFHVADKLYLLISEISNDSSLSMLLLVTK